MSCSNQFKGLMRALIDQGEASYGDYSGKKDAGETVAKAVERVVIQAREAYNGAQLARKRGITISYHNTDSYKSTPSKGNNVLAIVDPPYYGTKGYGDEAIVSLDTYKKTQGLLKGLQDAGNSIIYTDEAWWKKNNLPKDMIPLSILSDTAVDVLSSINDSFNGLYTFKMGKGRIETVGFHNATKQDTTGGPDGGTDNGGDSGNTDGRGVQGAEGAADGPVARKSDGESGATPSGLTAHRAILDEWIGRDADQIFRKLEKDIQHFGVTGKDYEIQDVPVSRITPSQTGEDYLNESSQETAKQLSTESIDTIHRREDALPILLDDQWGIIDGNHRHAAAVINREPTIPALVPVKNGTGKVARKIGAGLDAPAFSHVTGIASSEEIAFSRNDDRHQLAEDQVHVNILNELLAEEHNSEDWGNAYRPVLPIDASRLWEKRASADSRAGDAGAAAGGNGAADSGSPAGAGEATKGGSSGSQKQSGQGVAGRSEGEAAAASEDIGVAGIVEAFKTAFGTNIRLIEPTEKKFDQFSGVSTSRLKGDLFVSVNSVYGFIPTAGHELLHDLKRRNPSSYAYLLDALETYGKDIKLYQDRLNNRVLDGEKKYTADGAKEELLADFTGDALADPKFLQQLAEDNPTKFRKLLKNVLHFFDIVAKKLRGKGNLSEQYINDVDAMRAHLRKALNAFVEGKDITTEVDHDIKYMTGWHGSPHDHDGFTTNKIGTGEGNQAYGWGLYFAGNKSVAEWYRDKLTKHGDEFEYWLEEEVDNAADTYGELDYLIEDLASYIYQGYSPSKLVKYVEQEYMGDPSVKRSLLNWIEKAKENGYKQGKLYKVEMKPAEDEYLLWDKPLSEQSEKVKRALLDNAAQLEKDLHLSATVQDVIDAPHQDGQGLYSLMRTELRGQKAASEYLKSIGIRGIKYLDGSSRGKGDGDYNYVIFDEADVEIEAKFQRQSFDDDTEAAIDALDNPPAFISDYEPDVARYTADDNSPERQALRQSIIDEALSAAEPNQDNPEIIIVAGGTGSGKSAAKRSMPKEGYVVVERDSIMMNELPEYAVFKDYGDGTGSDYLMDEADMVSNRLLSEAIKSKRNVVWEAVFASPAENISFINDLKGRGYRVELRVVTADTDAAIRRAAQRAEHEARYVPSKAIISSHRIMSGMFEEYAKHVDRAVLIDTNNPAPVDIASAENGKLKITDDGLFERFKSKGTDGDIKFQRNHTGNDGESSKGGGGVPAGDGRVPSGSDQPVSEREGGVGKAESRGASGSQNQGKSDKKQGGGVRESVSKTPAEELAELLAEPVFSPEQATAQSILDNFDANIPDGSVKHWMKGKFQTLRPHFLGALTRRQIADTYEKEVPEAVDYHRMAQDMEAEMQEMMQEDDDFLNHWRKWTRDHKKPAEHLSKIMTQATLYQVHPDGEFNELKDGRFSNEERKAVHDEISGMYHRLPKDGKNIYRDLRGIYVRKHEQMQEALINRIERMAINKKNAKRAADELRMQWEQSLGTGPYFPLPRFGDHVLIAQKGDDEDTRIVITREQRNDLRDPIKELLSDGYTDKDIKVTHAKTFSASSDGASSVFANRVMQMVDKLDMGEDSKLKSELIDNINQIFLKSLPDMSHRTRYIHRKGVQGSSEDQMRAFARASVHADHQIAKINYGDKLVGKLSEAQERINDQKSGDTDTPQTVINELLKRHEAMMTPNTHPVAAALGGFGFTMSIGPSIASALVNTTQTPLVAFPILASKHGWGKAKDALLKASKDYMKGEKNWETGSDIRAVLDGDERDAIDKLIKAGVITLSQAHDLSMSGSVDHLSNAGSSRQLAMANVMKKVSMPFHFAEVYNRQVTALAAYRLGRDKGMSHEGAINHARTMTYDSHFDYSSSNRARYMQGNWMRVITMFKQYSQNMTYLLATNLKKSLAGESPEVKKEARIQFFGIMGGHFIFAGALGMPVVGFMMDSLNTMANILGDDDEPWDWESDFKNYASDTFGKEGGELLTHGPMRGVIPWDFASRLTLDDLWWRTPDAQAEGRDLVSKYFETAAGPIAGNIANVGAGMYALSEGHSYRGVEMMLPKFLKDAMKAGRYAQEGIKSWSGDDVMTDLTQMELLGQLLGFAPARSSMIYERRSDIKNKEQRLFGRKSKLIKDYIEAAEGGDTTDAINAIRAWNSKHSEKALQITMKDIRRSKKAQDTARKRTVDGVNLNKNREFLRDEVRY